MKNFLKVATQSNDRRSLEAQALSKSSSIARLGPESLGIKGQGGSGPEYQGPDQGPWGKDQGPGYHVAKGSSSQVNKLS